jgi:hypothetical protein
VNGTGCDGGRARTNVSDMVAVCVYVCFGALKGFRGSIVSDGSGEVWCVVWLRLRLRGE